MKNRYYKYLIFVFFVFLVGWTNIGFGQTRAADSLLALVQNATSDTNKLNWLDLLAWEYQSAGYYPKAMYYAREALALAERLNAQSEIASAFNIMGVVYKNEGNYSEALNYYFKALRVAEKSDNKKIIMTLYSNLGVVYANKKNYVQAKANFLKTLKIAQDYGDKSVEAKALLNLGGVYFKQKEYSEALQYLNKSLKLNEDLGNKKDAIIALQNIGSVYSEKGDFSNGLRVLLRAVTEVEKMQNKKLAAELYGSIGYTYCLMGEHANGESYLKRAICTYDTLDTPALQIPFLITLSELYEEMGNMKEALKIYKAAIKIRDSIFNQQKAEEFIRYEMNFEFDKKVEAAKIETEQKLYKERLISWSIGIGLLIVTVFSIFILKSLSTTKRQKQIIELKNAETEQQKKIIEEKNKDIMDSIHYAKRIQNALLREEEHVSPHLPEHFIIFLPKDVVSGDCYWSLEKAEHWYFGVADCTGHGVPGAIMSMLGISFLNDVVLSADKPTPAEVLDRLRDRVVFELRQTNESVGNKDGMDISLCSLNLQTLELQWAGANNPLNIIRNGQLEITKADKQPIGYYPAAHPFTNHKIQLLKGDSIYIYSDGYADQFGGPKGKKLTYKRMEVAMLENSDRSMREQKEALLKIFNDWRGAQEQLDDVCVVGIKV